MFKFVAASCSIPGIVPHKCIDGNNYVDGGVVCASSISYFRHSLVRYSKEKGESIHFTFSTCEDLNARGGGCYKSNPEDDTGSHIVQSIMDIVSNMINVSLVRDRVACNDTLCALGSRLVGTVTFRANSETLESLNLFKSTDGVDSGSILEIYSNNISKYMDMANFDGETCLAYMHNAEIDMTCRL